MTKDQAAQARDILRWIAEEEAQAKVIKKLLEDALNGDESAIKDLGLRAYNLHGDRLGILKQRLADL